MSEIVKFKLTNGETFGIYRQALDRFPNSFLARLFTHESNCTFHSRDADNAFVIDEDPSIFSAILSYYRCGVLSLPSSELRQAIIDKYLLSPIHSAEGEGNPTYVHITLEHPTSSAAQTRPSPAKIPALRECPFPLTHTNSFRATDPIDLANYLVDRGYTMEQIDVNSRTILMKWKDL